jgi:hypothetical protein
MAMGRPQKPYKCSWPGPDGRPELVPGLYKCPDGRWRINATGQKFTEPDERRAVQRFRDWQASKLETVAIPGGAIISGDDAPDAVATSAVAADTYWARVREDLIERPELVAKMTGIPEVSGLRHLPLPKAGLKLSAIIDNYRTHNPSTGKAKNEAVKPLEKLIAQAEAKTLDDLTTDRLLAFKARIEKTIPGPATRRAYYSRIRSVIGFGLKTGMDSEQIGHRKD